jgi:hypothetical protein
MKTCAAACEYRKIISTAESWDAGYVHMNDARENKYILHNGLYAAQIAWWLAFFPAEQILILQHSETKPRAPAKRAEVRTDWMHLPQPVCTSCRASSTSPLLSGCKQHVRACFVTYARYARMLQVLNRVLEFSGVSGAAPFTAQSEAVKSWGYPGTSAPPDAPEDRQKAFAQLRNLYHKAEYDLKVLLRLYWPEHRNFEGLHREL